MLNFSDSNVWLFPDKFLKKTFNNGGYLEDPSDDGRNHNYELEKWLKVLFVFDGHWVNFVDKIDSWDLVLIYVVVVMSV